MLYEYYRKQKVIDTKIMNKENLTTVKTIPLIILALVLATGIFFVAKVCIGAESIPYYFIAVHNEPHHSTQREEQTIEGEYNVLKNMVSKANEYNIKLTLMFTAQWVDYISESQDRMESIEAWRKQGHEIASHHHGIHHENWDGYTSYPEVEAIAERIKIIAEGKADASIREPEKYLGTLEDFIGVLKKINPNIHSGCESESTDKNEMPDEVVYSTCSGYDNYGEPGRSSDSDSIEIGSEKGKNEYITTGIWNDIDRKWLAHFSMDSSEKEKSAEDAFLATGKNDVYGVAVHSSPEDSNQFYAFLDFLHQEDPEGKKSKTVTEIIRNELLPEATITVTQSSQ